MNYVHSYKLNADWNTFVTQYHQHIYITIFRLCQGNKMLHGIWRKASSKSCRTISLSFFKTLLFGNRYILQVMKLGSYTKIHHLN